MTDYSQNGEQAAILAALADENDEPSRRRFLDIGAWHPMTFSNTRALFELGWSGCMIEPSPGCMRNLVAEYGTCDRITLIQAMAAIEPGIRRLTVTDDAVSTSTPAVQQQWAEAGGYLGNIWVPCITWGGIVNQFGGFDFVNIDAEGASVDLFIDMLAKRIMPICVCVEIDDGRDREMNQAATAAGYRLVFSNAANALYEYR